MEIFLYPESGPQGLTIPFEMSMIIYPEGLYSLDQNQEVPEMAIFPKTEERELVIIDAGCRWGFGRVWLELLPGIRIYGFDPDVEECRRLEALYNDPRITLVPMALAEQPGKILMYLTENPGCNSAYPPDESLTSTIRDLACASKVGSREVEATTLDLWASENGVERVDFIKLDTQGSELDILKGGNSVLNSAGAIEIEVTFNQIYSRQPLFRDIDSFLAEHGFSLWRMSNLVHYSRTALDPNFQIEDTSYFNSRPIPHPHLGGQLYWGHALYLNNGLVQRIKSHEVGLEGRDTTLLNALKIMF